MVSFIINFVCVRQPCRLNRWAPAVAMCLLAAAAARTHGNPPAPVLHGPMEHLQQTLVQSPAAARLIAGAERDLENGDSARAFLALRQLFAYPFDAFTPIASGQDSISSYQAALTILQRASYAVRANWTADTEPLAAAALQQASSDSSQIAAIARRFPYTLAGLQAHATTMMLAESRGQKRLARALLAEVQNMYANTAVSFAAGDILEMLSRRVGGQSASQNPAEEPTLESVSAGQVASMAAGQALPWPHTAWDWQESVWNYPEGINLFGGLTQPEQRPALIRNSWQPTLTADAVLLRSPFRIVALDRETGHEQWSLPTDTLGKPLTLQQAGINALSTAPVSVDEVLQMDDLGTVQVSERFVFFVDRFRRFAELSYRHRNQPRFGPGFVNPMDLSDLSDTLGGTRLVAVALGKEPRVAWTAGAAEPFAYAVRTAAQAKPESSGTTSAAADPPESLNGAANLDNTSGQDDRRQHPFANHHFMGVPLVYDQMLFVLSSNTETVWLNCLAEATGRLLWQHPVTYLNDAADGPRGQLLVQADPVYGASLCGISGNTVVCALNSGVVVGVQLTDGQLQWATNVRGEEQRFSLDGPASITVPVMPVQRISFPPLLKAGRMVWAAPQSTHIHCLEIATGKIVWKVSRSARGIGRLEGSDDHYAVAIHDDQVVMVGDRHVRALSSSTGAQQWVTEIPPQTGRAICSPKACVVPLQNGTLASIDLQSGVPHRIAQDVFARLSGAVVGALVADDRAVCAATPLSIRMFPAIEEVLAGLPASDLTFQERWTRTLASVLQADLVPAIDQLQQFQAETPQQPATVASGNSSADTIFSELLLQTLALQIDASGSSDASQQALIPEQQAITELQQLPLTDEQQLRLAVLTDGAAGMLQLSEPHTSRLPLLNLRPDWQVRLDVAAWSRMTAATAQQLVSVHDPQRASLSRIEQAILFPAQIGSPAQQLAFADELRNQNFHTANELFLLAAANHAQTDAERLPFQEALNRIRQRSQSLQSPLFVDAPSVQPPVGQDSDARPLSAQKFRIEETLHLHKDNRIAELLNARHLPLETPHWYPDRLFVGSRDVFRVDMHTGAVSIPIRIPEVPEDEVLRNSADQPGLYPIIELDHVGILSLAEPNGPGELWWKRLERDSADLSPLQAGPIGPGFMIVASEQALFCLHPLTGSVLWRRQLATARQQTGIYERALQMTGDQHVIGIFGQNMQSCEIFRTTDGQRLNVLPLDIPQDTTPLASGRHILYQVDQVLKLIDLRDGTDLMADRDPVRILAGGDARLISEDRAVLLTEDYQILVLDMHSGQVVLRCPVLQHVHEQKLTGLSAFERDGRLFVLLRDWGSPYSLRSSSAALGDQRLDSGTLFCLNSDTGELLWNHKTLPATMPEVYGDACPLLVKWSWHNPERGRELRLGGNAQLDYEDQDASLVITILNAATGETLAEQQQLSRYLPIRCTYDAGTGILKIDTDGSEIFVTPAP